MNWENMMWLVVGLAVGGGTVFMAWVLCVASGRESERERIEAPWIKQAKELRLQLEEAGCLIHRLRELCWDGDTVGPCSAQGGCECPPDTEQEWQEYGIPVHRMGTVWHQGDAVVVADGQQC